MIFLTINLKLKEIQTAGVDDKGGVIYYFWSKDSLEKHQILEQQLEANAHLTGTLKTDLEGLQTIAFLLTLQSFCSTSTNYIFTVLLKFLDLENTLIILLLCTLIMLWVIWRYL